MKKYLAIAAIAIFALNACKNKNEFVINGQVENSGKIKKVLLYENDQVIDSAFLNENSEFKFKRVSEDPNFYTIGLGDKNFLVIARNGDELDFKTSLTDSTNKYEIKGSDDSEKLREFNTISNKYGKVYFDIQNEYNQLIAEHPDSKDSIYSVLMPKFQKNMEAFSKETIDFSEKNKDNLAGFYAIGTVDQIKYEPTLIKYADDIKTRFPKNKAVEAFVNHMMEIKPVSIGQKAPGFKLSDPNGKPVDLDSYKGKYVLVDFWASWCVPCRQANPHVVEAYNEFKNKNFTVLGISLDKSKDAWLKAIKDDGLTWQHVSELKEWDSEIAKTYKVDAIPASFLLDPQGVIVAKNLNGDELKEFLNRTLK